MRILTKVDQGGWVVHWVVKWSGKKRQNGDSASVVTPTSPSRHSNWNKNTRNIERENWRKNNNIVTQPPIVPVVVPIGIEKNNDNIVTHWNTKRYLGSSLKNWSNFICWQRFNDNKSYSHTVHWTVSSNVCVKSWTYQCDHVEIYVWRRWCLWFDSALVPLDV